MFYKHSAKTYGWHSIYKAIPNEVFLVDRTRTFTDFPDEPLIYPACEIDTSNTPLSFEEVCNVRLKELEDLQPFRIMWSGGLDSSLVLWLCLDKKLDFEVYLSDTSMIEYPYLYKHLRQSDIKILSSQSINLERPIVTGELGDQIFGSDIFYKIEDDLDKDVSHSINFFKSNSISDYWTNYWYEVITSTCPLKLEYVFDFYWWYNFNFKYQSVWFRGQMPFQQGTYFKRSHYHFFEGSLWQQWSCSNLNSRRVSTLDNYKPQARELIKTFDNSDWTVTKDKVGSYPPTAILPRPMGVGKNYDLLSSITEKAFSYGPLTWASIENRIKGNFLYKGDYPVEYDNNGIPIDDEGNQCLPITCPLHPDYKPTNPVLSPMINDTLPSNLEWKRWFEENYIQIDNARIMREILRWYMKQERQSLEFKKIKASCTTLTELTEKIFGKTV